MPAADFLGYLKAMFNQEEKELKDRFKISGHIGWQINSILAAALNGEQKKYLEYLGAIGLLDEEEQRYIKAVEAMKKEKEKAKAKEEARRNIEKARRIREMDRNGRA